MTKCPVLSPLSQPDEAIPVICSSHRALLNVLLLPILACFLRATHPMSTLTLWSVGSTSLPYFLPCSSKALRTFHIESFRVRTLITWRKRSSSSSLFRTHQGGL